MSTTSQSRRFLGVLLHKFAGSLMKVAVPLAKTVLAPLATMTPVSAIDGAIQGKKREKDCKSRKKTH